MKRVILEVLFWLPVGVIPIFNGIVRLLTYQKSLGEPYSSVISSSFDIVLIFLYAQFIQRRMPGSAKFRGLMWILLSTLNHFVLGIAVFGMSFDQLISKYRIWTGETWLLITLFILLAPIIVQRLSKRKNQNCRPPDAQLPVVRQLD